MVESTLEVGELSYWEQVNAAGLILTHWVYGGKLIKSPRWLCSAFVRPGLQVVNLAESSGRQRKPGVSATANGF